MNKKKPIILAVAILLAIMTAVSASTFAWFTAQDDVVNRIQSASLTDGDVSIIETFDPEDVLMPGVAINKDVGAINTGDAPALVRISFSEALSKLEPMHSDPIIARYMDMRVRNAAKFTSSTTVIPQLVDVTKFEDDLAVNATSIVDATKWSELKFTSATDTTFPYDLYEYSQPLTATSDSVVALDTLLTTKDITILFKQPNASVEKYSFTAYAALGTTPETYQNVELRPELFNLVRVDRNSPPTPTTADDTWELKVMLTDPATGTADAMYDDDPLYNPSAPVTPIAIGNNGSARLYNFITLELANGGAPYEADWRIGGITGTAPVGDTHPLASAYVAGKMPAVTTAKGDKYLELLFHSANISTTAVGSLSATDVGKWWYNAADGFFYYLGVVEPGETTELLLDAVSLDGGAESDYSHVKFDLTVHMDAIQATKAAVQGSTGGGWGANYYDPSVFPTAQYTGGLNPTALETFLVGLCPN